MYNHYISIEMLMVSFRKGAKELIKKHAIDIQVKYKGVADAKDQYRKEMAQHRILFDADLQELFDKTLHTADHLSDIFKKSLENGLSATCARYREYYKTHY